MIPHASYKSIFGVFKSRQAAERCFRALVTRGFLPSEIGLLLNMKIRGSEFNGEEAPSEDEVLVTGSVQPSLREQVVRRTKELTTEGGGADANTTAVHEADMHSDGDSDGPTLATLVDVATPFSADGMQLLVFGLSFISAQSGHAESIDVVAALEGMGFETQDAEGLCRSLKNNAIALSIAISEQDQSDLRKLMLDNDAESTFVSH